MVLYGSTLAYMDRPVCWPPPSVLLNSPLRSLVACSQASFGSLGSVFFFNARPVFVLGFFPPFVLRSLPGDPWLPQLPPRPPSSNPSRPGQSSAPPPSPHRGDNRCPGSCGIQRRGVAMSPGRRRGRSRQANTNLPPPHPLPPPHSQLSLSPFFTFFSPLYFFLSLFLSSAFYTFSLSFKLALSLLRPPSLSLPAFVHLIIGHR